MNDPYVLDVGDLLTHPGQTRTVSFDAPLEAELPHASVCGVARLRARLEGLTDGVFLTGTVEVPVRSTCNRCLSEWEEDLTVEVGQLFTRNLDEDGYRIEEESIDTAAPVHDEVMLSLPLVPVCREDCKGICATCGADLNTAPCGGHDETEVSPFAVLRDLLPE